MNKLVVPALLLLGFASCSQSQQAATGRRVSLAQDNISFILPDSFLTYSKPILWPSDTPLGDYGETGAFYHSPDSSMIVSIYVRVVPNPLQRTLPWRVIADEKMRRDELTEKNRGLATIEQYTADSTTRAIDIDYHLPKRGEKRWRGQASFDKSLTIYGPQRTIEFWFSAPDDAGHRQATANARVSVRIDSSYLYGFVKPWPQREYRD